MKTSLNAFYIPFWIFFVSGFFMLPRMAFTSKILGALLIGVLAGGFCFVFFLVSNSTVNGTRKAKNKAKKVVRDTSNKIATSIDDKTRGIRNSVIDTIQQARYEAHIEKLQKQARERHRAARKELMYLSDNYLMSEFNRLSEAGIETVEVMALEEVLVERGLIEFSPLHEKIHRMQNASPGPSSNHKSRTL